MSVGNLLASECCSNAQELPHSSGLHQTGTNHTPYMDKPHPQHGQTMPLKPEKAF